MAKLFEKLFRILFPPKDVREIRRKYHIPDSIRLKIELTADGWFVASSQDLPGLVTQAQTQQELIRMVNDAVLTYFDVPRRDADIVLELLTDGSKTLQYERELRTRTT